MSQNNVKYTTAHLPNKFPIKNILFLILCLIIIFLIVSYPKEIGTFVGYWTSKFVDGFNKY